MRTIYIFPRLLVVLLLLFTIFSNAHSQDGPGGVFNQATSEGLWLKADGIIPLPTNGADVATWNDLFLNVTHDGTTTPSNPPAFQTNIKNGRPALFFDKSNTEFFEIATNTEINQGAKAERTYVMVFRTGSDIVSRQYLYEEGGPVNGFNFYILDGQLYVNSYEAGGAGPGNTTFASTPISSNRTYILTYTFSVANSVLNVYLDNTLLSTSPVGAAIPSHTDPIAIGANGANSRDHTGTGTNIPAGQHFGGHIFELLIVNEALTVSQRNIIHNYLGAKYEIPIVNDFYAYQAVHSFGIVGIGQDGNAANHILSESDNALRISNPVGLNDNEYIITGHDNGDYTTWVTTESPDGGTNIEHLAREWRIAETGGDLGNVTLEFLNTPALPSADHRLMLMRDTDGDFSNGADIYELDALGQVSLNLNDGDFIALAAVRPSVEFTSTASTDFENNTAQNIEVTLNYIPATDVDFEYSTTDGLVAGHIAEAAQPDYTSIALGTAATIAAGNQTVNLPLTLVDDGISEEYEEFTITIANPTNVTGTVVLGTITTHTFTIIDNDNARKVSFDTDPILTPVAGLESVWDITFTVVLSAVDALNPTSVQYKVSGGTATGGTDYTINPGTIIFPAGFTTGTINLTVINDGTVEGNETVIIELFNATNSTLSDTDPYIHTYTIQDDEIQPTINFTLASSSGGENNDAVIEIRLSAVSSQDITFDINAVVPPGNPATNVTDFNLNTFNPVTIPAGSLTTNVNLGIVDDDITEIPEEIQLDISNLVNATLGATNSHIYTIFDNDEIGFTGPGGVGDAATNRLWLRADKNAVGAPLTSWADFSGNGNNVTIGGNAPDLVAATINGKPALTFDAANNEYIEVPHDATLDMNLGFSMFTMGIQASQDGIVLQKGDGDGTAADEYFFNFGDNNVLVGEGTGVGGTYANNFGADYTTGTKAIISGVFDRLAGTNGTIFNFLNGTNRGNPTGGITNGVWNTTNGILLDNPIGINTDNLNIGRRNDGAPFYFDGQLAEIIYYQKVLNETQRILVENYVGAKYNIDPAADYYDQTSNENDVAGIGRVSLTDFHLKAQSAKILTVSDPSGIDNGEYLLFGHDLADDASLAWDNVEVPGVVYEKLNREWKIQETGDVGTVTITFDVATLPAVTAGFTDYVLLVDTDNDFTTGAIEYALTNVSGTEYSVSGISLTNGEFITISSKRVLPIVNFTLANASGDESITPINVEVSLDKAFDVAMSVDFTITDISATNGSDYTLAAGTLNFPGDNATTTQNIPFTVNDDTDVELNERFSIQLSNPTNLELGTTLTHQYIIADNDNDGYIGPGGVGDALINTLWLKGDFITGYANGAPLGQWQDASGNTHDADAQSVPTAPIYVDGVINDKPVARFDAASTQYLLKNTSIGVIGDLGATVFTVLHSDKATGNENTILHVGNTAGPTSTGATSFVRYYGAEGNAAIRYNNGNRIFNDGFAQNTWTLGTFRNTDGASYNQYEFFIDGTLSGESSSASGTRIPNTLDEAFIIGGSYIPDGGTFSAARFFDGDMAEVIVYNQDVNESRRRIIENYLQAKYYTEIILPVGYDIYSYDVTHGNEVAGIGRTSASDFHKLAQSAGRMRVGGASSLDDGDFLLFGHDAEPEDSWVTAETPGTNIQRLEREWRVQETGELGTVEITLESDGLPVPPAGYTQYIAWVDADGDFSAGATPYPMAANAGDYTATGVNLSTNEYVMFSVVRPEVQFTTTISNNFENVGTAQVEVSLNYPLATDVVVNFTDNTLNGDADEGGVDYNSIVVPNVTITAGNTTANIDITIIDDGAVESDETIELELSATSIGFLGANTIHTFTINDDDATIKVDIVGPLTVSNDESVNTYTFQVQLSNGGVPTASLGPTVVNYTITGTATEGAGNDYTITSTNSVTIPNLTNSTDIVLTINDDNIFELDETIIIELASVDNNANLGTDTQATYTIQNNDSKPQVQFASATTSGSESFQTVFIEVQLTNPTIETATVEYEIIGGSATNGTDYFPVSVATISFAPGTTTAQFRIDAIDDTNIEGNETVVFILKNNNTAISGINVVLGSSTYTILDDDGIGFFGPGGVLKTDDDFQNGLWLRTSPYIATVTDGNKMQIWEDNADVGAAGNDDAIQITDPLREPQFNNNLATNWHGKPVITFDPTQQEYFTIATAPSINGAGPYDKKTLIVAFRTGSDIENGPEAFPNDRQMIFEEGGNVRGLNFLIYDGQLRMAGYNHANDDAGATTPWPAAGTDIVGFPPDGRDYPAAPPATQPFVLDIAENISANTPYFAVLEFNYDNTGGPFNGEVRAYLNGKDLGSVAGAGRLFTHPNPVGVGGKNDDTIVFDGEYSNNNNRWTFEGFLGEVVNNSVVYNDAQRNIVFNYFAGKYDVALHPDTPDLFAYDEPQGFAPFFGYSYEMIGIGRVDANNEHAIAQGSGIIRLDNPTSLGNNDYLMIGHDNGGKNLANDAPIVEQGANDGSAGLETWIFTESPDPVNIKRVEREWRADETGDIGGVRVAVDISRIPAIEVGFTTYVLITDDDGDFTAGTEVFELTQEGATTMYSVANIDFTGDKFFTIGILTPTIEFDVAASNFSEAAGTVNVTVTTNAVPVTDITVDYRITGGGSATIGAGNDYTLTTDNSLNGVADGDGRLTILAGSSSADFQITISDDVIVEPQETIILELFNPSVGSIGTVNPHILTINDNDAAYNVEFTATTSSFNETNTDDPATIEVTLNIANATGAITVDYTVTGGTANNPNDYTDGGGGTLTIPNGAQTIDIPLTIIGDLLDEDAETILIELSNPLPAGVVNLGANLNHTFTIVDNDPIPTVEFSVPNSSDGAESFSPIDMQIELSTVSGRDVTVNFNAIGGTALGSGVDYTLLGTNVTIPAGSTTSVVRVNIIDDVASESDEDIQIQLTTATTGTVADPVTIDPGGTGVDTYVYTIVDNDGLGFIGPGGVGDGGDYQLWLKADLDVDADLVGTAATNGGVVGRWNDVSVSFVEYDADQVTAGDEPTYSDWLAGNNVNDRPSILFNGINDFLTPPNGADLNTAGPYTKKTFVISFRTGADVATRQMIYEQGGSTRGFNYYIEGGNLYMGVWNNNADVDNSSGITYTPWTYAYVASGVNANTNYVGVFEFEYDVTTTTGSIKGYLNGTALVPAGATPDGPVFSHGGLNGLGHIQDNSYYTGGTLGSTGNNFSGEIMEMLSFNENITLPQVKLINNYFYSKYGITGANDLFDDTTYPDFDYEVFGVGREGGESHIVSQGSGVIKLDNPNSIDNSEYMLIGHDNGVPAGAAIGDAAGGLAWTPLGSLPGYGVEILERRWVVDELGDVGSIRIGVDTTSIPAKPADKELYLLIVDGDNDGDFSTGVPAYYRMDNKFSTLVRTTVNLNDGQYFTIGVARNISKQNGGWDDPTTWTLNVPLADEIITILHDVTLTQNEEVGKVILDDVGADFGTVDLGTHTLTLNTGPIINQRSDVVVGNLATYQTLTGTVQVRGNAFNSDFSICGDGIIYNNLIVTCFATNTCTKLLCSDIKVNGNLIISGKPTLDANVAGPYNINLAGNWSSNAIFTPQTANVIFDGAGNQTIFHQQVGAFNPAYAGFYNMELDKASGTVTLLSDAQVDNVLTLRNGIMVTSAANVLTLDQTTAGTGTVAEPDGDFDHDSYVFGPMRYRFNTLNPSNLVYPVGAAGEKHRFILEDLTLVTGGFDTEISGRYYSGNANNLGYTVPAPLQYVSAIGYWEANRFGGSGLKTSNIRGYYTFKDDIAGTGSDLRIAKTTEAPKRWNDLSGVDGTSSGPPNGNIKSQITFSTFSFFSLTTITGNSPLPVTLINFSGAKVGEQVELTWQTASEYNTSSFEVQRSTDGMNFETIDVKEATGESQSLNTYGTIDFNVPNGVVYYRLKTMDNDGAFEYSKVIAIEFIVEVSKELTIYPVPSEGREVSLLFGLEGVTSQDIRVYNAIGQLVTFKINDLTERSASLKFSQKLAKGLYVAEVVSSQGEILRKKFIVK